MIERQSVFNHFSTGMRFFFIIIILLIIRWFSTASETYVGVEIVQTLAIDLLTSIDPS